MTVPARADEQALPASPEADLSNVIPFARGRRNAESSAPPLTVAAGERPAQASRSWVRVPVAVACSIAAHGLLIALLFQQPRPLASIGLEVISVELTLGAQTPAGLSSTQSESEAPPAPPSDEVKPDEPAAEQQQRTTEAPQEVPVAERETAPDQQRERETTAAIIMAPAEAPKPEQPAAEQPKPKQPAKAKERAPERKRVAARTAEDSSNDRRAASAPNTPASGVGRGRSDSDTNYRGLVAAHLARHKQYPSSARAGGIQGVGTVSFTLDGGGRVTSANLVRGTGAAVLDQEIQAMVRRASPFPAPPDGRPKSFTVPVRFGLN